MAPEKGLLLISILSFMRLWLRRRINDGYMLINWVTRRRRMRQELSQRCSLGIGGNIGPDNTCAARKHLLLQGVTTKRRYRRRALWVKPRVQLWWDVFNTSVDDDEWRVHFRMSRASFDYIVCCVKPYLVRQISHFRVPICVRKRVAVALWRLATGCEYRTVQELFGVGRSTACHIFQEFVTAVVYCLKERFLHHPTPTECRNIAQGFRDTWGFPQCIGALDGTHIPVIAPTDDRNDYFNRKGYYSIICQGIVDHRYIFWDVDVGWPGKVHDARVLANSCVFNLAQRGQLFPDSPERFGDVDVPLLIIGDPAYPLHSWLMKPYKEAADTPDTHRYFNYRLSRARMTIECAFGRLKGRWRCLMKRNDTHISFMPSVVMCCCILHNICEKRGEGFDTALDSNRLLDPPPLQGPEVARGHLLAQGQVVRDALCAHLSANRF